MDLLVAVGTTNPTKLNAVKSALQTIFPNQTIIVKGVKVPSGVSDQPLSDVETIEGAVNRAKRALELVSEAAYGIGVEGGIDKVGENYFGFGWTAVVDRQGAVGTGCSARFQVPMKVMKPILEGEEMAVVIDRVSGLVDNRSGAGAM
ncbi:hypothetical protein HDU79_010684, partial [Rhizoclosmatium sp. JEL0117]